MRRGKSNRERNLDGVSEGITEEGVEPPYGTDGEPIRALLCNETHLLNKNGK